MAHLAVTLENAAGFRLSVSTVTAVRSTAYENEARTAVETAVNTDSGHGRHGPWTVVSSNYTSA